MRRVRHGATFWAALWRRPQVIPASGAHPPPMPVTTPAVPDDGQSRCDQGHEGERPKWEVDAAHSAAGVVEPRVGVIAKAEPPVPTPAQLFPRADAKTSD